MEKDTFLGENIPWRKVIINSQRNKILLKYTVKIRSIFLYNFVYKLFYHARKVVIQKLRSIIFRRCRHESNRIKRVSMYTETEDALVWSWKVESQICYTILIWYIKILNRKWLLKTIPSKNTYYLVIYFYLKIIFTR